MRFIEKNHGAQAVMSDKTVLERLYNDKNLSCLMRSTERRAGGRHDTGNDFPKLLEELKVHGRSAENADPIYTEEVGRTGYNTMAARRMVNV